MKRTRGTVLVTGGHRATSAAGAWDRPGCEQGYDVRTTAVRSLLEPARAKSARRLARQVEIGDRLDTHAADLTADEGWDEAVAGCDYVLHVASPLGVAEPKDPNELISPARVGARRVVGAAIRAGVGRVVADLVGGRDQQAAGAAANSVCDETQWTDPTLHGVGRPTAQSKTLAERAAWGADRGRAGGATTLATVNPALVLGPGARSRLLRNRSVWSSGWSRAAMPGLPRLGFSIVDVRDVRRSAHPLGDDRAGGRRPALSSPPSVYAAWMADHRGAAARRKAQAPTPPRSRPARCPIARDPALAGLFDKDLGSVTPGLGLKHDFTSAKAQAPARLEAHGRWRKPSSTAREA